MKRAVDGANGWKQFRHITIPALRPIIVFTVVTSTIGGRQIFTEALLVNPVGGLTWRIAFPLVRPVALILGLFGFVNAWNDFLWPFIVLKSPERYTVQIAIKALQNNRDIDLGLAMSGSFLATLPLLVLFVFVGRRLVRGIMEGAFKG